MKPVNVHYLGLKDILVHLSCLPSAVVALRAGDLCHPRIIHCVRFGALGGVLELLLNVLEEGVISGGVDLVAELETPAHWRRIAEASPFARLAACSPGRDC